MGHQKGRAAEKEQERRNTSPALNPSDPPIWYQPESGQPGPRDPTSPAAEGEIPDAPEKPVSDATRRPS
jgi:hypothetical protein